MKRTNSNDHGATPQWPRHGASSRPTNSSRGEPVPDSGGCSLQDALQDRLREAPDMAAAGEVILALDQGRPIPDHADSDTCQQAVDLLMKFRRADLLLNLAQQRPDHYMLSVGTSEENAEVLMRTAHKWPKAATAYVVLSASLSRPHMVGLHAFFQRPTVLHVHLTVDSVCDPDTAQALGCALRGRQIGTCILSVHPDATPTLLALQGLQARAFTLRIPPGIDQGAPFHDALVALLRQSGATVLDVADAGIGPSLSARLVDGRVYWDSVTARFDPTLFNGTIARGGTIDRLAFCAVPHMLRIESDLRKIFADLQVEVFEIEGAMDLDDLADNLVLLPSVERIEACFMLPQGADPDRIPRKLMKRTAGIAIDLCHRPLALAVDGYDHIDNNLAMRLAARPLASSLAYISSDPYMAPRDSYNEAVVTLRQLLLHAEVGLIIDAFRAPDNACIPAVDLRHLALNSKSFDMRDTMTCLLAALAQEKMGLLKDAIAATLHLHLDGDNDGDPRLAAHLDLKLCCALIDTAFPMVDRTTDEWLQMGRVYQMQWPIVGIEAGQASLLEWPDMPERAPVEAAPAQPVTPPLIQILAAEDLDATAWTAWHNDLIAHRGRGLLLLQVPGQDLPVDDLIAFLTSIRTKDIAVPHLTLDGITADTPALRKALHATIAGAGVRSLICRDCKESLVLSLLTVHHWDALDIENAKDTAALFKSGAVSARALTLYNVMRKNPSDADFARQQQWIQTTAGHCKTLQTLTVSGSSFNIRYFARTLALNPSIRHVMCLLTAEGDGRDATDELKALRLLRHNTSLQYLESDEDISIERDKEYVLAPLTEKDLQELVARNNWLDPADTARNTAKGFGLSLGLRPDQAALGKVATSLLDPLSYVGPMLDANAVRALSSSTKAAFFGSRQPWEQQVRALARFLQPETPFEALSDHLAMLLKAGILVRKKTPQPAPQPASLLDKVKAMHAAGLPAVAIGQAIGLRLAAGLPPSQAPILSNVIYFSAADTVEHLEAMAYIGVVPARQWIEAAYGIDAPAEPAAVDPSSSSSSSAEPRTEAIPRPFSAWSHAPVDPRGAASDV